MIQHFNIKIKGGFLQAARALRAKTTPAWGTVVMLSIVIFALPHASFAAWNDPTCNPDDAAGPTATACNVSAPLNVSSASQTKSGAFTVQNTLSAGKLQVSNTYGSTGNVTITTSSGVALDIKQNDAANKGLTISGSSSKSMAYISQSGSGYTLELYTEGNDKTGLYFEADGNNVTAAQFVGAVTGVKVESTNTSSVGIKSKVSGTAFQVDSSRTPSIGLDVPVSSTYGVKAVSSGQAGYFESSSTGTAVKIKSTASDGEGLDIETSGQVVGNIPLPSGYSSSYFEKSGVRAVSNNFGVIGYTADTTAYASGVYGVGGATNGTGGIGVFGYSKKFYGVYGDVASTSTYYGGLFCNNSTNCADLGGATYSGYFHGQVKVDATAGAALDVSQTSSSGEGINISVPSYATALDTNGGFIKNTGATNGGQFYPNENAGTGVYQNVKPFIVDNFSLEDSYSTSQLLFDGSSIWLGMKSDNYPTSNHILRRISAADGRKMFDLDLGGVQPGPMAVTAGDVLYNCGGSSTCVRYPTNPQSDEGYYGFSIGRAVESMAFDGQKLWLGTSGYLYSINFNEFDFFDPDAAGTVTQEQSGRGVLNDMVFANGYLWITDSIFKKIYKVDSYGDTVETISLSTKPTAVIYDGAFLWIANYDGNSLSRMNVQNNSIITYDLSSLGIGPKDLAFDGAKLWIAMDGGVLGYLNVATGALAKVSIPGGNFIPVDGWPDIEHLVFDGTYLWATNASTLYKIAVGVGSGISTSNYSKGLFLYGSDGTLYCAYAGVGGFMKVSSTDFSECQ